MWDQRYGTDEYVYGTDPNDFLAEAVQGLVPGRALCLAEGEGRNACFLASRGFEVTAVDSSGVGLAKAERLASDCGVGIRTVVSDLADFPIEPESWDLIVSIFCHVPPSIRENLHHRVVAGLRPGGHLILEAYRPAQIELGTGGPPVPELTMSLETLHGELAGLDFEHAVEIEREVVEGKFHTGRGAVVQVVGVKPAD